MFGLICCSKYCNKLLKCSSLCSLHFRKCSYLSSFRQEFTVSPFCSIDVNCPFNVRIQPLNVFEQGSQDKVIVNLLNDNKLLAPSLYCAQTENNIRIFSNNTEHENNLCVIDAPVKANIDVTTTSGSVYVGSFENDYLNISSTSGNITVDTFRSAVISLSTHLGNIICKKVMQASKIDLETFSGMITTGRLQGDSLNITTQKGNISTESSYCTDSTFRCTTGNVRLQNLHKNCGIYVEESGRVDLLRVDGTLELVMNQGAAEVLISRIIDDSVIHIEGDGVLILKMAEECQNHTAVRLISKDYMTIGNFNVEECQTEGFVLFKPKLEIKNNLLIDCKHSNVNIKSADFLDMFNLTK